MPIYLQISPVHEIFGAEYYLAKSSFHKKYHWHLKCWTNHNPSNTQLKLPHAAVKNCTYTKYIIQVGQFIDQPVRCKPRTLQVIDIEYHVLLNQINTLYDRYHELIEHPSNTHNIYLPMKLIITIEKIIMHDSDFFFCLTIKFKRKNIESWKMLAIIFWVKKYSEKITGWISLHVLTKRK